jgi:isopenicillin N synthase-like dioxygenase
MPPISVPTLDLRQYHTDRPGFVGQVRHAYSTLGFCCFSGHGLDPVLLENAYRSFRDFFLLPPQVKQQYFLAGKSGTRGYTPFKTETAKSACHADLKEFWHVGREEVANDHPYRKLMLDNVWPSEIPDFRTHALALYNAMEQIGRQVLRPMATAIGLPEDYFLPMTAHGNSILRALHYPPVRLDDLPAIRAHAHEDISFITLLPASRGAGLELLTLEGEWVPVAPEENAIIVNVGDMLQRLTNNVYRSTTHRVVNPVDEASHRSRYSLPFFLDPNPDFLIKTLPGCVSIENPNLYPEPILANDYLHQRLAEIKLS